jgi:hypothetical protein
VTGEESTNGVEHGVLLLVVSHYRVCIICEKIGGLV